HFSLSLPAHEILRGLEQHHVGGELTILELLLDLLIEHVAESALDRNCEAGKLLLELPRQRLVVRHRSARIDHHRFFVFGLGVKLVECFSARRTRKHEHTARRPTDRSRDGESGPTHPLHGYSPYSTASDRRRPIFSAAASVARAPISVERNEA